MINLIPPDARTVITKEYWLRVVTVWLWLFAAALLIVAILNIPSYVLIQSQLSVFTEQYNQAQIKQGEFERSEIEIKTTNALAGHLAKHSSTTAFTTYLTELDALARAGIEITQFKFNVSDQAVESIGVVGIAVDRASLTAFSDAVEDHRFFSEAQIPIANLAKDSDINFNITIMTRNGDAT